MDEWEQYREKPGDVAPAVDDFEQYKSKAPGDSPENPINEMHPDLSTGTRELIKLLQTDPAQGLRKLGAEGFQAKHTGGFTGQYDYALRKPGGKWFKVDPSGWHGFGELLRDTLEFGEDAVEGTLVGLGAAGAATVAAPTTPIGMAAAGAAGAAGTASAISGAKSGLGRLLGLGTTGEEAAKDAIISGVTGGIAGGIFPPAKPGIATPLGILAKKTGAEALGTKVAGGMKAGLEKAAGALKKPALVQGAKKELGAEIGAEQVTRLGVRQAREPGEQLRETLRVTRGEHAAAQAEKQAAAMADNEALMQRVMESEGLAEKLIKEGKELAGARMTMGEGITGTVRTETGGTLKIPSEIASPTYGITASAIKEVPEVGAVLRKHFGEEFVPIFVSGEKRGSHAMLQRSRRLYRLIEERGTDWAEKAGRGFVQDMAALMRAHPKFAGGLSKEALAGLEQAARGQVSAEAAETVMKTLSQRLTGRAVSPELAAAIGKEQTTKLAKMKADATLKQSAAAAGEAAANRAHRAQMIKTAAARVKFSQIAGPKSPYASFGQTWLGGGGRAIGRAALGGLFGYAGAGGLLATAGGAALGAALPAVGRWAGAKAATIIERLLAAPAVHQKTAQEILSRSRAGLKGALFVALKNSPAFRVWFLSANPQTGSTDQVQQPGR